MPDTRPFDPARTEEIRRQEQRLAMLRRAWEQHRQALARAAEHRATKGGAS